jgi:hypothetical protein
MGRKRDTAADEFCSAIKVAIGHASSDPVEVFLPYVKRKSHRAQYGELFAQAGTARVFSR